MNYICLRELKDERPECRHEMLVSMRLGAAHAFNLKPCQCLYIKCHQRYFFIYDRRFINYILSAMRR